MQSLLERKELAQLLTWSSNPDRKPLVIRGARQVGKSTLVRQLATFSQKVLVEINFERNPECRDAFTSNQPSQILMALRLLTGQRIEAGSSLLFFDEIQAAPEALVALRYFYEELPNLHIVAAGSLLEFTLAEAKFSMPVGRIEYFHLGALQFDDFIRAVGQPQLADYLDQMSIDDIQNKRMIPAVHDKLMGLLREFCVVGGLPEAVAKYVSHRDFTEVSQVQQGIVATYRDDFNKYSHGKLTRLIQMVFDQLPIVVGQKFKYSKISRDHRAAEIDDALTHLCLARIATRVFHTSANGIPLAAEINQRYFKTLYLDVGLMCAALRLNVLDLSRSDLSMINNGAIAEQFIGQQLLYSGPYYHAPELFYWVREAKNAAAEIDYLVTHGQQVIPVEIKAGTTGTLKSLHQFLKEKQLPFAIRFNADQPSLMHDSKKLTDGTEIAYKLLSLPLYMVAQTHRLMKDSVHY